MIPFQNLLALVNERQINLAAIDIGNDGGLTANERATDLSSFFAVHEMPDTWKKRAELINSIRPTVVYTEDVHSMPGQGVVSSGSLMEQKGFWRGIGIQYNIEFIQPLSWIECYTMRRTKHFKSKKEWKDHLTEIARGLLPEDYHSMVNRRTADSFLIWHFAAHILVNERIPKKGKTLIF